jgi:hypothetical protein
VSPVDSDGVISARNWLGSLIALLLALCVAVANSAAATGPSLSVEQAAQALQADSLGRGRMAMGECLPVNRERSRFSCRIQSWGRPADVPADTWSELLQAVLHGNQRRFNEILGVSANSTEQELKQIEADWFSTLPRTEMKGLRVVSARNWVPVPAGITLASFGKAITAAATLRSAIPAIEAYYSDHGSYGGMTAVKIRAIDKGISRNVRIGFAGKERYCTQIKAGTATLSYTGPGGPLVLARCPAP